MASQASSLRSAKLADRRTSAATSSMGQPEPSGAPGGSRATMATTCWASTSRGLRGYRVRSTRPWCMRSTTTAASTRSLRCLGKSLPRLGAPTWWPARPTRCRPAETDRGDSTCTTRSTAPMSMPSSRLEVHTRPLSRPALRSSSIWSRRSRAQRAVVGLHEVDVLRRGAGGLVAAALALGGELVEAGGQALGQAPGVDEDQRRPVRLDELEQLGVHRRPDGPPGGAGVVARSHVAGCRGRGRAEVAHVLDRHHHLDLQRLADAGVDDGDVARPATVEAAEEAGDLLERPLRGRQADALGRAVAGRRRELLEALQGQRQVGAPLGGRHRVDLVDDDGLDARERLPGPAGEHEVEGLGRGDQQVRRVAQQLAALVGGRVAGADAHRGGVHVGAQPLGGQADAGERGPQVLLDVDGERP